MRYKIFFVKISDNRDAIFARQKTRAKRYVLLSSTASRKASQLMRCSIETHVPPVALYRLISHFVRNARFAERFTRKHVNARGLDFCFRKAYTVPVDDRLHVCSTSFALLSPIIELCLGHGCKVVASFFDCRN